jgi:MFS family permease
MRRLAVSGTTWHFGQGREIGYLFWAMVSLEAAYGAYAGIWPLWIASLGAPVSVVGLVLGAAGLMRLVTLAPSAALAERIDPRKLILVARCFAVAGLTSAALASHWTQLWFMVIATAIGEIAFPLTQSHLAALAKENRVRAFTLVFNVGPAVAFGLAPLIAGALIAQSGMRSALFLGVVFGLFSIAFFFRLAPIPPVEHDPSVAKVTYGEALALPGVRRLLVLQFVTIFSLSLGISLLPNFLAEERGIPVSVVAVLGGIGSIGSVVYGLVIARSKKLQALPLVGVAVAALLVATTVAVSVATAFVPAIVVAFLGRGGLWSAWGLYIAALGEVVRSERHRPRAFTLSEMVGGTAFFSAPIFSGFLYEVRPSLPLLVSLAAVAVLVPTVLANQKAIGGLLARAREGDVVVSPVGSKVEVEVA